MQSIADNYYCESGNPTNAIPYELYPSDPLWDGQQCEGTCCSGTKSPPWFSVQLPTHTTDRIEVRICADELTSNEDIPIQQPQKNGAVNGGLGTSNCTKLQQLTKMIKVGQ